MHTPPPYILFPRPPPDLSHGCEIKSGSGLGTRLPPPKDTENITPASTVANLPPFVSGKIWMVKQLLAPSIVIVHWRWNLFKVNSGKAFICELTQIFRAYLLTAQPLKVWLCKQQWLYPLYSALLAWLLIHSMDSPVSSWFDSET